MTQTDIILVAGLASLAVAITLGDLLFLWWRRRHEARRLRLAEVRQASDTVEMVEAAARNEAIRKRLAAIQAASGNSNPTNRGADHGHK